jgi:O-antigen/teichoic acid export membrane protein
MKRITQLFVFDTFSKVISGVTSAILIRFMAVGEYANYVLALSFASVVISIFASSFNRIYIVGYERLKLNRQLSSFLGLQLLVVILISAILSPFAHSFGEAYWFTILFIGANCSIEYAKTIFQQELRFLEYSLTEAARTILAAGLLILLIYVARQKPQASDVILLSGIAAFLVFLVISIKRLDLRQLFRVRDAIRLAGVVISGQYRYLFGYFFVLAFFTQVDAFMLKIMASDSELATYGSAFRYYTIILVALNSIHTLLLPIVQRIQSTDELDRIYGRLRKALLFVVPSVILGMWLAQWVIPFIDQGKYPGAVPVFRVLSISAIISLAFSPHANLVMRFEDFRFLLILITMALVGNIALNMFLIPLGGAIGTAFATLIAFGSVNGCFFLRTRRYRKFLVVSPERQTEAV